MPQTTIGAGVSELVNTSAVDLVALMQNGEASVVEVMEAHLSRIEETNAQVNAIVALDTDRAMDAARRLDEAFTRGREDLPALYGLPIAHKDTLPAAGWVSTSGTSVYANRIPDVDHIVIERERRAGAVTIGRTNVPELGLGSHTFNPVYGQTHNPWDLSRSAGGSSGGAAAALTARMLPVADGSDTGGSLRTPASFCNVVGLRPTVGAVPSWPEAVPWSRLSVKGPLARTVRDLHLLLTVQAGEDPRFPAGRHVELGPWDTGASIRGVRAAWSPDLGLDLPVEAEVRERLVPVVEAIASAGVAVGEGTPDLSGAPHAFSVLRAWQMEATLGPLVDAHREDLGSSVIWNVELGRQLSGPEIGGAELHSAVISERMRRFFSEYDFLLCPVVQVSPFDGRLDYPHEVAGVPMRDYLEWMTLPSTITMTGCPAVSLPATFTAQGLPIGIQIVGKPGSEQRLLEFAAAVEEIVNVSHMVPPLTSANCSGEVK
ncbi:amidase [Brevibacterium oceani]|uniref:amidase n=1 Tax=Brevibacterium oceani TaxID=358099 RepID=UPI001B32DB2A|nr:amidase family protein [Brevibacterium oceani]